MRSSRSRRRSSAPPPLIRRGKVVAIPTDALYTLVADPLNLRAVASVFRAKGREIHRSLPLLVADVIAPRIWPRS